MKELKENPFELEVVSVRLVKEAPLFSNNRMQSPIQVIAALGEYMCEFDREVVCVVNLRADLTPINVNFASVGAVNAALAHPRELLKTSILSNASNILLIHCHPSGQLLPSKEDTILTDRLNNICDMIGIPLIDHIIVGGDNIEYFSFKEKGLIKNPEIKYATDYRNIEITSPMIYESKKVR